MYRTVHAFLMVNRFFGFQVDNQDIKKSITDMMDGRNCPDLYALLPERMNGRGRAVSGI
jgi:hypothetical protein